MPYHPLALYDLLPDPAISRYSRPRHDHPDGSYEIHLVRASDPLYIPGDIELWPIFHSRILQAIGDFPDAVQAAQAAYLQVRQEYTGRKKPRPPSHLLASQRPRSPAKLTPSPEPVTTFFEILTLAESTS